MIVGGGLLATAFQEYFKNRSDVTIFASGVANSQEQLQEAFERERRLLQVHLKFADQQFVYFSSCSLYDEDLKKSPYVIHKRAMESLIRRTPNHTIFRLPQVVGKTNNTKTLANFIFTKIITGEHFNVWKHAKRNIIDVADVSKIANFILNNQLSQNSAINIANANSISIIDLVRIFELVLNRRASYSLINGGNSYQIDTTLSCDAAQKMGIYFDEYYVENVISKYYGQ